MPRFFLTALLLLSSGIVDLYGQFTFVDQTSLLRNPENLSAEFSSGVPMAVVDINGDGRDDIVRLHQRQFLSIELQSDPDQPYDHRWHGLLSGGRTGEVWSVAVADTDRNGRNDILFGRTRVGMELLQADPVGFGFSSTVLHNRDIYPQGAAFADIDNDGKVDLFACHDFGRSQIYRNIGDGFLRLDDGLMGPDDSLLDWQGNYATIWTDFDNDGDLDMYLSKCKQGQNSGSPNRINQLWVNDGAGNYTEAAEAAGLKDREQSWCADFADIDNDGDLDCLVLNHTQNRTRLLENNGNGVFTDISAAAGLGDGLVFFGIQALFRDFDNDGWVDLFIASSDLGNSTPVSLLYRNKGDKRFTLVPDVFTESNGTPLNYMRSFAIGDLNHDGFLDIYSGRGGSFNDSGTEGDRMFFNVPNANHWLAVQLRGTRSNPNGIGARLEIHGQWGVQLREVRAGEGYGIMNSFTQHFGLGTAEVAAQLVVRWPSGVVDELSNVAAGQFLEVVEGSTLSAQNLTAPQLLDPGRFSAATGHQFTRTITVSGHPTHFELIAPVPPGMEIHPTLGQVTWTPATVGTHPFTVRASNAAGADTREYELEVAEPSLELALDTTQLQLTSGGDTPWRYQQAVARDGTDAVENSIDPFSGVSWMETTVEGPDLLHFAWRTSVAELRGWLKMRVDGDIVTSLAGESDWTDEAVSIPPGTHTIRWEFEKNIAPLSGRNAVWIDQVRLASEEPEPMIVSPEILWGQVGEELAHQIFVSKTAFRFEAPDLPPGLEIHPATGAITGTPLLGGESVHRIEVVLKAQQSIFQDLRIHIAEDLATGADTEGVLAWQMGGSRGWHVQSVDTLDGIDALEVSGFDGLGTSWLSTTVTGPDVLEFARTLEGFRSVLGIELDGELILEERASTPWHRRTISIPPGAHELRFSFTVLPGRDPAEQIARIDQVRLASVSDTPILILPPYPPRLTLPTGSPLAWQLPVANAATFTTEDPLPNGLILEPTGRISGTPTETGEWTIHIVATSPTGQSVSFDQGFALLEAVTDDLGEALDLPGLVWGWSGDAPWQFESTVTDDGIDSARSGAIAREDRSTLWTTVIGPGRVNFRWKISADGDDELDFTIKDQHMATINGEDDWQSASFSIPPGNAVIRWGFDREDGRAEGLDAAFLDQLSLTGYAGWIVSQQPSHLRGYNRDNDGDGMNQLLEFAFQLSAVEHDPPPELPLTFENGFPVVTIARPPDSAGMYYVLERSTTLELGSWTRDGTEVLIDDETTFQARITASGAEQFVRIVVVVLE